MIPRKRNMPKMPPVRAPKCAANSMPKELKDTMWHFLMVGGQKADEKDFQELKDAVNDLCHATMQKNAGQQPYAKRTDINWDNLDWVMWRIILAATTLVLSDRLMLKEEGTNQ